MKKITQEKYKQAQGNICPCCESEDIEGGHIEVQDGGAIQPVSCNNCGAEWEDLYNLDSYINLEKE
jgi:transcription elongation factor Elf1